MPVICEYRDKSDRMTGERLLRPGRLPDRKRPIKTYKEEQLSYEAYLNDHLIANEPFIIRNRSTTKDDWMPEGILAPHETTRPIRYRALSHAQRPVMQEQNPYEPDLSNKSNDIKYVLRKLGNPTVPVANCASYEFGEMDVVERPLEEVLDDWTKNRAKAQSWYVKDWHLMAQFEREGRTAEDLYRVPEILWDDWLNPPFHTSAERARKLKGKEAPDDFRFCYAGPPLTFTPIHRDVYGSYSWSYNLAGRKLWYLFPPGEIKEGEKQNVWDWPDEGQSATRVLQNEGETIFIPSGWYHQVVNLDFTISFNHNFFCSATLPRLYDIMIKAQERAADSISDVKDMIKQRVGADRPWEKEWLEEVQELLRRDAGWGWKGFWETILQNLNEPPAPEGLSPPVEQRDASIRDVLARFEKTREYELLPELRNLAKKVEGKIGAEHGYETRTKRLRHQ